MVVKMKKMELLLFYKERERFLDSLRSLGVVHIVENQEKCETPEIQSMLSAVRRCERITGKLNRIAGEIETGLPQRADGDAESILERFEELEARKEKYQQEISAYKKDAQILEPWGNFDPQSVKRLLSRGIGIRFFIASIKQYEAINQSENIIQEINRQNGQVYFIAIEKDQSSSIVAEEVRLPDMSINDIEGRIKELMHRIDEIDTELKQMTAYTGLIEKKRLEILNRYNYARTNESMAEEVSGRLLHLSGWVPDDKVDNVKAFFETHPVYFSFRDPLPNEDVPVKLKNSKFSRLFEPITGIYSLPDYSELDITPFMAPFFTIFFGLCLGDAGYGGLLLLGCLIAGKKLPAKMKPVLSLMTILSISTIISGILLNSFFGQAIFGGPGVNNAFFSYGVKTFSPLSPIDNGAKGTVFPGMSLAILLGFIQLLFGMGLKSYIGIQIGGFKYGIQPLASMLMILGFVVWAAHADLLGLGFPTFSVGPLLIGKVLVAIPLAVAYALMIVGLLLFFTFNNLDKKAFLRPLLGLYELYNFASGLLGNILSYLRLFALGLAGGLLGGAFNQIAFMFITTADGKINYASAGIIGTILVLIIGHGLNLGLSLIGPFVHPLRLTFVEFYGAIGFKGGSKAYKPFAKLEQ